MNKFKKGDIVICIDNYGDDLTCEKEYEVLDVDGNQTEVWDDADEPYYYPKDRFKLKIVTDWQGELE